MNKWKCSLCNRFSTSGNKHNCRSIIPMSERIWKHVSKASGCWNWSGAHDDLGYGRIGEDYPSRKSLLAHRAMWIITNGPILNGLCVLHKCDTPSCVNPSHLFLGTKKDNTQDMVRKGRCKNKAFHGEEHPSHKLTGAQIIALRERYRSGGITYKNLGAEYGIHAATTCNIVNRKIWKHIR